MKTNFITLLNSWSVSFGSNTGPIDASNGLSITEDNSFVVTPYLNTNTNYQDGSGKK